MTRDRAVADANEAVRIVEPIGDAWLLVHAEAIRGAIAQGEHRFDEAAAYLRRAAVASERLGFLGQAAYHLTTLGRIEQRAGNEAAAIDTLHRAIAARTPRATCAWPRPRASIWLACCV